MVFPVRLIAGGITLSDVFEQAWDSIVKIDEGMWEEIYAPLYEVLGGRGKNKRGYAGASSSLDFVPTEMLPPTRHFQGKSPSNFGIGDQKVERLMESIMEHGMLGRNSDWWVHRSDEDRGLDAKAEGLKRYDKAAEQKDSVGNVAIPQLNFNPSGWMIGEGNHRVEALRRMNAPFIPAYMISSTMNEKLKKPQYNYDREMIYGKDMRRLMGLDSNRYALFPHLQEDYPDLFDPNFNEEHRKAIGGYGIPASFGRRRNAVPPSFFFGRELVPGMGRLIPDLPKGLSAQDIPMEELRTYDTSWGEKANDPTGAFSEFQDRLNWRVI